MGKKSRKKQQAKKKKSSDRGDLRGTQQNDGDGDSGDAIPRHEQPTGAVQSATPIPVIISASTTTMTQHHDDEDSLAVRAPNAGFASRRGSALAALRNSPVIPPPLKPEVFVAGTGKPASASASASVSRSNSVSNMMMMKTMNTMKRSSSNVDLVHPDPQVVDVVSRHLVANTDDLKLQGGDITHGIYKWTSEHPIPQTKVGIPTNNEESNNHDNNDNRQPSNASNANDNFSITQTADQPSIHKRSTSFSAVSISSSALNSILHPDETNPETDVPVAGMTHSELTAPGGFRRAYLLRRRRKRDPEYGLPDFITRNFIEFLTLYGHFAGEDLSEEEEEEEEEGEEEGVVEETETTALLPGYIGTSAGTMIPTSEAEVEEALTLKHRHKATTLKAVLLLLKSFVGTGVLFLPKAFQNGGWGFSTICLLSCALISYYCFIILINTKDKIQIDGYGDMGQYLYGKWMKLAILSSIALSQIGFAAAYTVFTATNLKVFVENATGLPVDTFGMGFYILLQAMIFIPLALTRNIAKLSGTALIADLFILLGLVYVYYYATFYVSNHGIASRSMQWFNKTDWTLFIGTAIFTFEGIGLLIPIQESMRYPEQFHKSLSGVMVIVTLIFISCGLLCYSAFGSRVETVVLLNFPQASPYTLTVQFLYALAILLSTPLQLFPAIKILENWVFPPHASGKHNPRVKWLKNYFRCGVVLVTALVAWIGAGDLDKFVSLIGSLACIPLIYIHPPLLHYRAYSEDPRTPGVVLSLAGDVLILVFGVIVMCYTSWQTVVKWAS